MEKRICKQDLHSCLITQPDPTLLPPAETYRQPTPPAPEPQPPPKTTHSTPNSPKPHALAPLNYTKVGDRYDWTTEGPYDGNEWRKYRIVPRVHPLRPCVFACFHRSGSSGAFRLPGAAWDRRHGITSIVRWNLRPVMFGVEKKSPPRPKNLQPSHPPRTSHSVPTLCSFFVLYSLSSLLAGRVGTCMCISGWVVGDHLLPTRCSRATS